MKKLLLKYREEIISFLTPQPEIKEEYIYKAVTILRESFTVKEQNEILLSIGKKLSDLRQQDIINMEKEFEILQTSSNELNLKMSLCNIQLNN